MIVFRYDEDYRLSLIYSPATVRMAERSKAPDSSVNLVGNDKSTVSFWSTYVGVGSNPTSDKYIFVCLHDSFL